MSAEQSELAASIEETAESLAAVLDPAGCVHLAPVSPAQLRVLLLLRAQPTLNVNGLAEALHVVASSASRLLDRLEALGLIRRVPDPRDRREIQLPLTADATEMLDELGRYRRAALETVLAAMPPSARRDLARSLAAFAQANAEVSGSVPARARLTSRSA